MWHGAHDNARTAEKEAACELGSKNNVDSGVWVKLQDQMENKRACGGIPFAITNQQLLELQDLVMVEDERDEGDSDENMKTWWTRAVEKRIDHL